MERVSAHLIPNLEIGPGWLLASDGLRYKRGFADKHKSTLGRCVIYPSTALPSSPSQFPAIPPACLLGFLDDGLEDGEVLHGPVILPGLHRAHALDNAHALRHAAKNGVLAVQPGRGGQRDETVWTISIYLHTHTHRGSTIGCHWYWARCWPCSARQRPCA